MGRCYENRSSRPELTLRQEKRGRGTSETRINLECQWRSLSDPHCCKPPAPPCGYNVSSVDDGVTAPSYNNSGIVGVGWWHLHCIRWTPSEGWMSPAPPRHSRPMCVGEQSPMQATRAHLANDDGGPWPVSSRGWRPCTIIIGELNQRVYSRRLNPQTGQHPQHVQRGGVVVKDCWSALEVCGYTLTNRLPALTKGWALRCVRLQYTLHAMQLYNVPSHTVVFNFYELSRLRQTRVYRAAPGIHTAPTRFGGGEGAKLCTNTGRFVPRPNIE